MKYSVFRYISNRMEQKPASPCHFFTIVTCWQRQTPTVRRELGHAYWGNDDGYQKLQHATAIPYKCWTISMPCNLFLCHFAIALFFCSVCNYGVCEGSQGPRSQSCGNTQHSEVSSNDPTVGAQCSLQLFSPFLWLSRSSYILPQESYHYSCPSKCNPRYVHIQFTVPKLFHIQSRADSQSDSFRFTSDISLLLGFVIGSFIWLYIAFHMISEAISVTWQPSDGPDLLPCPGFLVVISDPFDMSCKVFSIFCSILCIASQGHKRPGSFSLLLAIAVAVQSRVCPDYEKFVFLIKNTSFFHAKVFCHV